MAIDAQVETLTAATQRLVWLPRLIAISDAARFGVDATVEAVAHVCQQARPRSVVVQLREMELPSDTLLTLGTTLRDVCRRHGQDLCINHHLDLALTLGCWRVHRKPASLAAPMMRRELERRFECAWLTQGWHPDEGDAEPAPSGVDAVLVSPVQAPCKGRPALGQAGLERAVARVAPVPVFALGGVDASSAARLTSASVPGVAAQAAWYIQPDALLDALGIRRVEA